MNNRKKTLAEWVQNIRINIYANFLNQKPMISILSEPEFQQEITEYLENNYLNFDDQLIQNMDQFFKYNAFPYNFTVIHKIFSLIIGFFSLLEFSFASLLETKKEILSDTERKKINHFVADVKIQVEEKLLYLSNCTVFDVSMGIIQCYEIFEAFSWKKSEIAKKALTILEEKKKYSEIIPSLISDAENKSLLLKMLKDIFKSKQKDDLQTIDIRLGCSKALNIILPTFLINSYCTDPKEELEDENNHLKQLISLLIAYDMNIKPDPNIPEHILEGSKFQEFKANEESTRSILRNTLLFNAGFFKPENKTSQLKTLNEDLIKKITNTILETALPQAETNMSPTDLEKLEKEAQQKEDQMTFPRLNW